jgi:hypothetical protein
MRVSISHRPGAAYPDGREFYSPSVRYPEYRYAHVASKPNLVYEMVRQVLADYGLDCGRLGTPEWNPLGDLIAAGSSAFILCNFVYHRRPLEAIEALWSKCTHASVIRALADYVLLAVGPTGNVAFGNAPLQSADWDSLLRETGAAAVLEFYRREKLAVEAKDLRLYVERRDILGGTLSAEIRDDESREVEVDLGADSLLAGLGGEGQGPTNFRVTQYDPRRIERFHRGNGHRYVINRAALGADVIISLPKLKTHAKVGITCCLKGVVGAVGHKDCLAHHRFGDPSVGGDEYPTAGRGRRALSRFHDWVYTRPEGRPTQRMLQTLDTSAARFLRRLGAVQAGGWWGNDTAWRMALDLARILHYSDPSGHMRGHRQRRHLALVDGIIGGEGDGPLSPRPIRCGLIAFGEELVAVDHVACRLMGFDPQVFPLLREAMGAGRYPLVPTGNGSIEVLLNGVPTPEQQLGQVLPRPFRAPRGWKQYLQSLGVPGPVGAPRS